MRRPDCFFLAGALILGWLTLTALPASAHGRYPATDSIAFDPRGSGLLLVGTTFGTLLSADAGQSWSWMCDQSVGYDDNTEDPVYAITDQGTLLAATLRGLAVSRDRGCSWSYAGTSLAGSWITDLVQGDDGSLWVTTALFSAGPSDVYVSHDDARSFQSAGMVRDGIVWQSMRIAGATLYVTGLNVPSNPGEIPVPVLYASFDGGKTFTERTVPALTTTSLTLLWAEGDLVFARTERPDQSVLHRSLDGGQTWQEVLVVTLAELTTVVAVPAPASPAGAATPSSRALASDPGHFLAGTRFSGVYESTDNGATFTLGPSPSRLACAVRHPGDGDLYGCADNRQDSMALGRSSDGVKWTSVLTWPKIAAPLSCPASSPQFQICQPYWPIVATTLGIELASEPGIDPDESAGDEPPGGCGGSAGMLLFLPILPWRRSIRWRRGS